LLRGLNKVFRGDACVPEKRFETGGGGGAEEFPVRRKQRNGERETRNREGRRAEETWDVGKPGKGLGKKKIWGGDSMGEKKKKAQKKQEWGQMFHSETGRPYPARKSGPLVCG